MTVPGTGSGQPLPNGWRWVRLGEVSEIIAGQSPPGTTYRTTPDGLPFYQGKADFGKTNPVVRVWCVEPTKIAKPGDILISVRAPVGPTNVADAECCIGRGLAAIRCGKNSDRDFILNALRHFEARLVKKGSGSTFQAINRDDLESFEIPLPPLPEQRQIASALREQMAAVEKARTAAQARLEAVKALPAAFLRQVFPQSGQPLPNGWYRITLGEVCSRIRNGTTATQIQDNGGIPVTRIETISSGKIDPTRVGRIVGPINGLSEYMLEIGDILFSHINSVERLGNCALYEGTPENFLHGMNLLRMEPKRDVAVPEFLLWCLRSEEAIRFYRDNARRAIGQASLNIKDISALPLTFPPIKEQQQIAGMIKEQMAKAEKARVAVEEEMNAINALPAALLRRAFNGEI